MAEPRHITVVSPGTDVKFRLTVTKDDFTLAEDYFDLVIKNEYGRVMKRLTKNDFFYDSEGRWYFALQPTLTGMYSAYFVGYYEDDDFDKQTRRWSDKQLLFVCREGCMARQRRHRHPQDCPIEYVQVWSVSVDGEDYLADCYGRYVYTSDGKRIQFTNATSEYVEDMGKVKMKMTGKEFLKKWEGRDPNGEIDTIPEMFDAAQGISDDETIPQKIQKEIDESQEENEASDADIDSIFD